MAYSELVKDYERIRDYMRQFYVYGFKSRDEYDAKSARSYDNERRRVESWLGDYMSFHQNPNGKSVFLSLDSRAILHNPLYKSFKAKSFTDKDITLHFYILDILADGQEKTSKEIVERIVSDYLSKFPDEHPFDESTVRKKLKEYETLGLLVSEKRGREVWYRCIEEKVDLNDLPELTGTRKLVLLVMGATFALLIVGVLKWGWYINELSALFLGMGIVVGFEARVGFDGFGRLFSRGVADFAAGALAVGFARGILIVLEGGNILHTILYGASGLLTSLPSSLTVLGMYVFQNFLNLLIPSASGQAATSLPILLPMGDMADITRQTTCIIFQIGNGLSNILVPTSGTFMVALTMAKVPYGKWAKWFIPLLGLQFAAGAVLVLIANAIRLGPM